MDVSLSRLFFASRAVGEAVSPDEDLEALLAARLAEARRALPDVELAAEAFVPFLARWVPADAALPGGIDQLHIADLYLACACLQGDRRAIERFDQELVSAADLAFRTTGCEPAAAEDIRQEQRVRLLVGVAGHPPKLETYSGRGSLFSWLRVIVVRAVQRRGRRRNPELADDRWLAELASPADDAEIAHLKRLYRSEFRTAFQGALTALTGRERNMLRYRYLEGLSIDQIGEIHGVHRATVARWIKKAQETLMGETRARMMEDLVVDPDELESILRLVRSRLEVSIRTHLAPSRED